MNNILKVLLIFFFITSCSLHGQSKFWSPSEKIEKEVEIKAEEIFVKEKSLSMVFNQNLKISLASKPTNRGFFDNYDNNNGRINYDGDLKKISRFKFSKIDKFNQYDPIISFQKENIIFFYNKVTILKFYKTTELVWKKNYYSKFEKKQKPVLLFANNKNTLIVADNIAKYYALDIISGNLLWSKNNNAPFNSQIKIYKDYFFIIDHKNTLRCFSVKNGSELWNVKTETALVRTQKKLSLVIVNEKIYFNNSIGDISAVDVNSGELLWQRPTQSNLLYDQSFFLKTSELVADNNSLYLSNNKNQFFSIDINTGSLNWQQKINSNLRPTIIDNYIFTISLEGYLIILEKKSGNIIRITDPFKKFNKKYFLKEEYLRDNIMPVGFIIGKNKIYLTTNNGKLIVIDTATGETINILKIDKDRISRPLVLNKNLFIIKDNSIIKLD